MVLLRISTNDLQDEMPKNIEFVFYASGMYLCSHWTREETGYWKIEDNCLFYKIDIVWQRWDTDSGKQVRTLLEQALTEKILLG